MSLDSFQPIQQLQELPSFSFNITALPPTPSRARVRLIPIVLRRKRPKKRPTNVNLLQGFDSFNISSIMSNLSNNDNSSETLNTLRSKTPSGMRWRCTTVLLCYMLLAAMASERKQRQSQFAAEPQEVAVNPCTTSSGAAGTCTELARCVTLEEDIVKLARSSCALEGNDFGVCCPNTPTPDSGRAPISPVNPVLPIQGNGPPLTLNDLNQATRRAQESLRQRDAFENNLLQEGVTTRPGTPESDHQVIVFTFPKAQGLGRDSFVATQASAEIAERLNLGSQQSVIQLPKVSMLNSELEDLCPKEPTCPATKYRNFDGSCNNVNKKSWGKSFRAFARMLPPKYSDGVIKPRVATDGSPLPSARLVSQSIIPDVSSEMAQISLMLMAWGQFLDHDLTQTPIHRGKNGTGIVCCSKKILANPALRHPECLQVEIPENDPFYSPFKQKCMEFVRSLGAPRTDCTLGPREQMNQLTAFIDASQIYGSAEETAKKLRIMSTGKLNTTKDFIGRDLPPSQSGSGCVSNVAANSFCFQSGDTRVNEQPQLTSLHIVWLREHNRIANELKSLNPNWNDETVFQESRKIVAAMMQYITYNEYLPIVLGRRVMRAFDLLLKREGYSSDYDPTLDPTIFNEFATAAYRFGHSTIPGSLEMRGDQINAQALKDHFLRPYQANLLDSYIRGALEQSSMNVDTALSNEITTQLFKRPNGSFGLDLAALNIQRGRDHGLPSYNDYREFCRLDKARSWDDISRFTSPNAAQSMSNVYRSVDDIDLWLGGISEKALPGAIVGPTFACILGEQFRRLKKGDRFWHELGNAEGFTEPQLEEIRKSSLARVLCDNSDAVTAMQPLAFFKPESWNPQVDCNSVSIPSMSLLPWKTESFF